MTRLGDANDAGARTGFTRSALYRQRYENRPPGNLGFKVSKTRLVFDLDEVDAWVLEQRDAERQLFASRSQAVGE